MKSTWEEKAKQSESSERERQRLQRQASASGRQAPGGGGGCINSSAGGFLRCIFWSSHTLTFSHRSW